MKNPNGRCVMSLPRIMLWQRVDSWWGSRSLARQWKSISHQGGAGNFPITPCDPDDVPQSTWLVKIIHKVGEHPYHEIHWDSEQFLPKRMVLRDGAI